MIFFSKTAYRLLCLIFFSLTSLYCDLNLQQPGQQPPYTLSIQNLSLTDSRFTTCNFDPQYSIVHFPMYHFPSYGQVTQESYERISRSQFQLLHSILNYNRSFRKILLFEESVSTDNFDESYFQNLQQGLQNQDKIERLADGKFFLVTEQFYKARELFAQVPRYYEHLSLEQKDFLLNIGAAFALYFIGEVPKLYKVISSEKFNQVVHAINQNPEIKTDKQNYWIVEFRERALQEELMQVYRTNIKPNELIFISYGADHDFSDEFAGQAFQSGHNHCLLWDQTYQQTYQQTSF